MDLVAGDAQRFDYSMLFLGLFMLAVFEICLIVSVTWYLLGFQALAGILFMVLLTIYFTFIWRICTNLRNAIAKVTDERLNVMKSIIPGIRVVKMHAWETPFQEAVGNIRRSVDWFYAFINGTSNYFGEFERLAEIAYGFRQT